MYTYRAAARQLGWDTRTLRLWQERAGVEAARPEYDSKRRLLSEEQVEQIRRTRDEWRGEHGARVVAGASSSLSDLLERLAALEAMIERVNRLERIVERIERIERLSSSVNFALSGPTDGTNDGALYPMGGSQGRPEPERARVATRPLSHVGLAASRAGESNMVPEGLVPVADYCRRHDIAESVVAKATRALPGRTPRLYITRVDAPYQRGRQLIYNLLDNEQRAQFHTVWRARFGEPCRFCGFDYDDDHMTRNNGSAPER